MIGCVYVCVLGPSIPCSRRQNAAITPLAKEGAGQGCWEKAEGVGERDVGKEGREDGTQLTWPITANEVRYKQRGRQRGSMSVEDMDTMTRTWDGRSKGGR